MRLHRFFVEQKLSSGGDLPARAAIVLVAGKTGGKIVGKIKIENDELIHQWRNVLRFQVGQEVILLDNSGLEFRAVIVSIGNRSAEVEILESRRVDFAPPFLVFLYIALTKRHSFEWTLEKGTELGVSGFVPIISERSEKKSLKIERSKNIIKEACEQSGRAVLPEIFEQVTLVKSLENLCAEFSSELPSKLFSENSAETFPEISFALDPTGEPFDAQKTKLNDMRQKEEQTEEQTSKAGTSIRQSVGKRVNIFIGPEGGFSPREIELFRERDIPIYSISKQILRAETAAVAIASIMLLSR